MTTKNLDSLRDGLLSEIASAADLEALEVVRVTALGKQGSLTTLLKGLGKAAPEERKSLGQAINNLKIVVNDGGVFSVYMLYTCIYIYTCTPKQYIQPYM